MIAPPPLDEKERLEALRRYEILDTDPEQSFDDITLLASHICETPIALISLLDEHRQWFKSKIGLVESETSRDIAFCAHGILQPDVFEVEDARADVRFVSNPLVTGKDKIRFYAGAPLVTADGHALGMLCVQDQVPRKLGGKQTAALRALSRQVVTQLELRQSVKAISASDAQLRAAMRTLGASELSYRRLFEAAQDGILILNAETGHIDDVNPFLIKLLGFSREEMIGKTVAELSPFQDMESNKVMLDNLQQHGYVRYHDLPLEAKDGTNIAVEFVSNVYQAGDRKVIQCNVRDITERKKFEEKLRLLNTCVSNLNDIVLITEANLLDEPGPRIVFANEAFERITGYTTAEALGRSPRFLQGENTDKRVLAEIHQALSSGQSIRRQIINYKKDGSEFWLDIDIVPVMDAAGKLTHFAAFERDITGAKQTEESLKLFRTLMERSPDAIEVVDPATGRFLDVNETACRRLGYTREEMLSLTLRDIIDADNTSFSFQDAVEGLKKSGFKTVERRHRRKDGSHFPVEINIQYIDLNEGYVVAVIRDITDRRVAEDALRTSELNMATAQRISHLGSWEMDLTNLDDVDSNPLHWSDEIFRIAGYEPDSISPSNDLFFRLVPVVEHGRVREAVAAAISQRQPYSIVHRLVRPTGEERFVHELGQVILDEQTGKPLRLVGTTQDITERNRADEKIKEQAALLDKTQDAILVRDLMGIILFWNKGAERVYGWTHQEAIGQNATEFFYSNRKKFEEVNALTIRDGEWHGELQHLTKDRREITIEARWTLLRDDEGNPKSVLAINTDITEKKMIEAQFMRAQRMESIGTLAGGIAHDLNNILAPILMSIDILKLTASDPQAKSVLETIEISAKRGADIVRQVLSFARGLEGERVEVQPKHLLQDVESIIKDTFPKDIQLRFNIPNDIWTILGDPTQIHQILLNLCVNARDAMPHGGILTINVENSVLDEHYTAMNLQAKAGRYVNITVTDSGTGIPPNLLEKIFEPFFTTKGITKGTGLGLSTVMGIVKSHGGLVNVYSEANKGTTFKVYLPATEISSEARKTQLEQATLPRGNGETVLLVDDEASILAITSQTLLAFGYKILTASDGAEAVAAYAEHKNEIAVVLTDMAMPIMDGAAAIRALSKINPAVKIIAASGLHANADVTKASSAGIKHFLTKPYTAGTLLKTLRTILEEL